MSMNQFFEDAKPAMVCTINDLSNWENFPKGLRVLLLDGAGDSAVDTRSKLESLDYNVKIFTDENDALSAVSRKPESFHIAIVEVNTTNKNKSFKFLEAAKDLPTIMISSVNCLSTMMRCIALGAVEFLHKPLSEDKLKNIWQHVVHKAFNDGGSTDSESLKSVKESVVSMLHLELDNRGMNKKNNEENVNMMTDEKDPAPSTPQLKQGSRLLDDGDCQENANCSTENMNSSTEKENMEDQDVGESKSVETTNCMVDGDHAIVKEEGGGGGGEADDVKSDNIVSLYHHNKEDSVNDSCRSDLLDNKSCGAKDGSGNKTNRKKVDWTPELHKKFVQAVEQLGIDQAIPSRILELMKVEGLTRHNVASHLQKFRMHRRNILPKEDHNWRWIQPRGQNHNPLIHRQMQHSSYFHQPIIAYPAAQPPMYPVWGLPGVHPAGGPRLWPPFSYATWPWPEGWHWKPPQYPTVHNNAWGCCPVVPPSNVPCYTSQNFPSGFGYAAGKDNGFKIPPTNCFNLHPDEEVVDKVVKEAISKPWLPLPLGLKPPSADSVLAELSRQGISAVPPNASDAAPRLC